MKPPLPRLLAITVISLLAITGCAQTDQPYEVPEPQQTVSKEDFGNNNVSGSIGTGTEDFGSSNVSGGIGITEDNSRFNLTEPPVDIPPMEGSVPEGWTPR